MPERASLLTVYQRLPQTNCGECGEATCMSFASGLLERRYTLKDCPPLKKPQYVKQLQELIELISPPVAEVAVGRGRSMVKVGGKEVLYRHELTYHNPTAIAIDISDTLEDKEIAERCRRVEEIQLVRIGETLKLDMVALRCVSGDPERFAAAASLVVKNCSLPLILCSFDTKVLEAALKRAEVEDRRPLLYAVTKDNWRAMVDLAKKVDCPVAVFAPEDMEGLVSLVKTLSTLGIEEIVIDPGTYTKGKKLADTLNRMVMLRRAAIRKGDKTLGYPLLCVPAVVWMDKDVDPVAASYKESYMACTFLCRFADILVMHTLDLWALLPVLTLRQNLYTDPRKPVAVEAGLKVFGEPDENSPVLLTTNFALTYYTVANDIEASNVTCYLLVADTEGLAVEVSVAGGQLTSTVVKEVMDATKVEEKVKHRRLIIPQLAARLRGELEDVTHWEVLVGPRDSSEIKTYLEENWKIERGEEDRYVVMRGGA